MIMLYNPLNPHHALFNLISMAYGITAVTRTQDFTDSIEPIYLNITHQDYAEAEITSLPVIDFPVASIASSFNRWYYDFELELLPVLKKYYCCQLITAQIPYQEHKESIGFLLHPNYHDNTDIPVYFVLNHPHHERLLVTQAELIAAPQLFTNHEIKAHQGLLSIVESILPQISRIRKQFSNHRFILLGHGVGAGLAILLSLILKLNNHCIQPIALWLLASPAVGNKELVKTLQDQIKQIDAYHLHGDAIRMMQYAKDDDYVYCSSTDLSAYIEDLNWQVNSVKNSLNNLQLTYCLFNQVDIAPIIKFRQR